MSRFAAIFSGLDRRDRRLLAVCLGLVAIMVVVIAVFAPARKQDDPVPSSYGVGDHGAKAAYLTLGRLGYTIQRWTQPLSALADTADEHTTLILADPFIVDPQAQRAAVDKILERGGRVLAAGASSGVFLSHSEIAPFAESFARECDATPVGLDSAAGAETLRIRKSAYWMRLTPADRTEYVCDGKPVVVAYRQGKGQVTWWADTLPLENLGITKAGNLALFLRSIGPPTDTRVYWDESLHEAAPSLWSYARGTPVHLAILQATIAALLLLFSYSRRSGPLRADPIASRASPIEFVRSLGGLFHKAHATNAAVDIANQHFRRELQRQFGIATTASAAEAAYALERRVPHFDAALRTDLETAEKAADGEPMKERKALILVQALEQYEHRLRRAWSPYSAISRSTLKSEGK